MIKRKDVVEYCGDQSVLFLDGFDDCVIGICEQFGRPSVVVYDRDRIIAKLSKDMSAGDAEEYYSFNIIGGWVGEYTPVFVSILKGNKK